MPKMNKLAFTFYEESNPLEKVVDFLTVNHFAAVISPLHNQDTWTEQDVGRWRESQRSLHDVVIPEGATTWRRKTGEMIRDKYGCMVPQTEELPVPQVGDLKKEHRHCYLELDYSMPMSTALEKVAPLNINYLEVINSKRGYLRYLCHLDNDEKARYAVPEVISLGGVDISCLYQQDESDKIEQEGRIYQYINEFKCHSIANLIHVLQQHDEILMYKEVKAHFGYWERYMRGNTYMFSVHKGKGGEGEGDAVTAA